MAHADYDCCVVCDNKQSYNAGNAAVKGELCSYCAVELARRDVWCRDADEFESWVTHTPLDKVVSVLAEMRYRCCFYHGSTDRYLLEHGVKFDEDRYIVGLGKSVGEA